MVHSLAGSCSGLAGWFHQGKYYVAYFHLVRARAEQPWRFGDFIKAPAYTRGETMRRHPRRFAVSSALFVFADRSCGQRGRCFKELSGSVGLALLVLGHVLGYRKNAILSVK